MNSWNKGAVALCDSPKGVNQYGARGDWLMKIKKNALIVISFGILMILVSSSCGEKYPITKSSDGYTFQVDENQNATLIKADSYSEVIEVPQTIDSYKVIK